MPSRRTIDSLERLLSKGYAATGRFFLRHVLAPRYGFPPDAISIIDLEKVGAAAEWRNAYGPSPWRVLRRIIRPEEITRKDVFLDVGCGMGVVLLDAARLPFRRVLGVDVVPEFTDTARQLLERNRHLFRCGEFEITTADVLDYEIPDDVTVVYLNDPFRGVILDTVIERLIASVDRRPRMMRIIFLGPSPPIVQLQGVAPPQLLLDRLARLELVRVGRRQLRRWSKADYLRLYQITPRVEAPQVGSSPPR